MKLIDIEHSREQVKRFLRALATSRGFNIDSSGRLRCPAHDDHDPSANLVPGTDETKWYCHVCHEGGDIFDFGHFTDGLPRNGAGWIRETLPKLAEEFGIELHVEGEALSADEQREFDIYQAYERACRLVLTLNRSDIVENKLGEYRWSKRTLRVMGIGGVPSTKKFVDSLVKMGYTREFLAEIGLTDERIFRPECLIFTVKDAAGRPIGFSSRYLHFERDQKVLDVILAEKGEESAEYKAARRNTQAKYINTGSKNPIYRKREVLFGYHAARKSSKTLYIFEGNADDVTAYDAGIINSCAVCGTGFNESHFAQVVGDGFNHLIFVMDGDKAGLDATRRVVELSEKFLADKPAVRVDIIDLPVPEGTKKVDPDSFLREHGIAAFSKLPRHSYLYWLWRDRLATSDSISVAADAAPKIIEQPDPLLRYDLLVNLSELTGIPVEFLWETIVRLAAQSSAPSARDILASAEWVRAMRQSAELARQAVEQAKAEQVKQLETAAAVWHLDGELVPFRTPAPALVVAAAAQDQSNAARADKWK